MGNRLSRSTVRSISEMNLTPMMDLTFLLLITFIITFPLLEQGIPVRLPKGKAATLDSLVDVQSVSVDAEGRLFLNDEIVDPAALEQRLADALATQPDLQVLVRGDDRVPYGRVVSVLQIVHRLGISRMALVTREE